MAQTPKIFHVVWIGDDSKEPKEMIQSWADLHPDFELRVYRNNEPQTMDWMFKEDIDHFISLGEYCGAADLMRWQMLYEHGGISLDADSLCVNRLPSWLLDCETAVCWDNGKVEGQLLNKSFCAAIPQSPIISDLIQKFKTEDVKKHR